MFDNDNHSNGVGLAKYKELQGKDGLLRALKTSEERGIIPDDAETMAERIKTYGTNAPRPVKIKALCELIMEQLEDKTLRILIIACIASLGIGIWRDLTAYYSEDPDKHVVSLFCEFSEGYERKKSNFDRSMNSWKVSVSCLL